MRVLLIILFIFILSDSSKVRTPDSTHQQVDSLSIKLDSLILILEQKQKK